MSLRPVNATVTLTWDRKDRLERVRIHKGHCTMGHHKVEQDTTLVGDFDIFIDVEAIARKLIAKAQRNASHRAVFMGGLIKVTGRQVKVLERKGRQIPLPDGWEEVQS